jgi:hypothetical protein
MRRTFKWDWPSSANNIQPVVQKFKNYLQDNGYRASVIEGYVFRVKNYLKFAGTSRPTQDTLNERTDLHLQLSHITFRFNSFSSSRHATKIYSYI